MPVDKVSERRALLEIAHTDGSLNNEQKFRNELERFQNRFQENRPSVIDVSSDADKLFRADIEAILALAELSMDREIKSLCFKIARALQYLGNKQE